MVVPSNTRGRLVHAWGKPLTFPILGILGPDQPATQASIFCILLSSTSSLTLTKFQLVWLVVALVDRHNEKPTL